MLEAGIVVIISPAEVRTSRLGGGQFLGVPSDEDKVLSWKAEQKVLDSATSNSTCSRENADGLIAHGVTDRARTREELVDRRFH